MTRRALIARRAEEGFVIHSLNYSLCVDVIEEGCTYKVAVFGEGDEYDFCPLGRKCKRPWEGWKDLLPFSVLITPNGIVVTDGKSSLGLWNVPEAVHVDMIVGIENKRRDVPFQDLRMLEEGDHVEPFAAVVFRESEINKMKLEDKWFELIVRREKVVEGRLYDEKRKKLRVGQIIQFKSVNSGALAYARIKRLTIYNSFAEMLENEERVLPGWSVEEGVKVYEKYYGPDAGPALAIGIEVL